MNQKESYQTVPVVYATFSSVSVETPALGFSSDPPALTLVVAIPAAVDRLEPILLENPNPRLLSFLPDFSSLSLSNSLISIFSLRATVSSCLGCAKIVICCSSFVRAPTTDEVARVGG